MKKLKSRFGLALMLSLLVTSLVTAAPTLVGENDQDFDQNQNTDQLNDYTITQEVGGEYIEAGYMKLIIPDDLQMIWDDEESQESIVIYGPGVDNGKVDRVPELLFEDGDKEMWIPVHETFDDEEYVVVTRLFVQGFHARNTDNTNLSLQINDSETIYLADTSISIRTTSNSDTNDPEMPSDIVLTSTIEGVEITWTDPTDLDLVSVEILKGQATFGVTGDVYVTVPAGTMYYLDTNVSAGDELTYILRSLDEINKSENTEAYTITYTMPLEEEEEEVMEEEILEEEMEEEEIVEDELEEEVLEEETTEEIVPEPLLFEDVLGHWGEAYIESLYLAGVVSGNDDGTFGPDEYLNRAALAKMLVLAYTDGLIEGVENPYDDVSEDDWYMDYAASAYAYGIMTGEADGSFNGAAQVNRATLMQAVYNAAGLTETGEALPFTDVMSSDWFYAAVDAGYSQSVIDGESETTFNPSGLATRAAAAKVIYNGWYAGVTVVE